MDTAQLVSLADLLVSMPVSWASGYALTRRDKQRRRGMSPAILPAHVETCGAAHPTRFARHGTSRRVMALAAAILSSLWDADPTSSQSAGTAPCTEPPSTINTDLRQAVLDLCRTTRHPQQVG